jgi:hypothetical protein
MKNNMKNNYTLRSLEAAVTRLTDLPKYLLSTSKKERQYGEKILNEEIRPALREIGKGIDEGKIIMFDDWKVLDRFGEYLQYVEQNETEKARRCALDWLRIIKDELKLQKK